MINWIKLFVFVVTFCKLREKYFRNKRRALPIGNVNERWMFNVTHRSNQLAQFVSLYSSYSFMKLCKFRWCELTRIICQDNEICKSKNIYDSNRNSRTIFASIKVPFSSCHVPGGSQVLSLSVYASRFK